MTESPQNKPAGCRVKPFVLVIRDGWGYSNDPATEKYNAPRLADTPVDDSLMKEYPHTLVATSGEDVGLPDGTMGNSEVGHQNIGAGRIVYQESMRITKSIREGDFFQNKVLLQAIEYCKKHQGKLHLIGLASNAGVHSLLEHLYGLLDLARKNDFSRVYLHALTDGRDTPPNSGIDFLEAIEQKMAEMQTGKIATIMGRFYAMDRDKRWQRVEEAYQCLRYGKGRKFSSVSQAMQASYDENITDEFIKPVLITGQDNQPIALVEDGDAVIFFNFRGDRPREITRAFVDPDFSGFDRGSKPEVYYVCMTEYDATIPAPVAFPRPPKMRNILGEYWSKLGLRQFRCAETEKYAHVTFFFNDYTEPPYPGEDRQIIPSPKVETYDLKPEMSAFEVCDAVLAHLESGKYDVVVVNFANPDMVGHTGSLEAAIIAAQTVDKCLGRVLDKVEQMGGSAIVTADHGNFELMYDVTTHGPHTAHTTTPVPLVVFDEGFKSCKLRSDGRLADIAPTLLQIMGLEKPQEMTGETLILC